MNLWTDGTGGFGISVISGNFGTLKFDGNTSGEGFVGNGGEFPRPLQCWYCEIEMAQYRTILGDTVHRYTDRKREKGKQRTENKRLCYRDQAFVYLFFPLLPFALVCWLAVCGF